MVRTHSGCPPPPAQIVQPLVWRTVRSNSEPRRSSPVTGSWVTSAWPRQVQRFLSAHDQVANVFPRRRDHDTAANLRFGRTQAFTTWADVTGVAMAA
jgi:hypothetical protein